jgi:DNA invertase Pin-like site-specific DNA recombinase
VRPNSLAHKTNSAEQRIVRCAIYARKSSEEGLAQPFNSLDAQRESAEAYISSQRHMGWTALERRYEDGGYTGANLERPALRALLDDIQSGQVDCVVVYKVDRLSRSLLDFARLIGVFEERGVSLVSVTQQMNTTDSLGRLTLNILLSFAQFERELIAERTRDKMQAARRKGKWLGGNPVLGYDVDPRGGGLKINTDEAERVRFIFQSMAEAKSGTEVLTGLSRRGWTTKTWISRSGRQHRGRAFQESDVIRLVKNVTYMGKLRDGEQIYPGEHAAIVDSDLWERANAAVVGVRPCDAAEPRSRSQDAPPVPGTGASASRPVPRISRLLALALKMEEMIQDGTVKKYSDLAHLGQVSAARITQMMNLLHLAPDIQEQILSPDTAMIGLRESAVRKLSSVVFWSEQRVRWQDLLAAASAQERGALRPCLRPATQP